MCLRLFAMDVAVDVYEQWLFHNAGIADAAPSHSILLDCESDMILELSFVMLSNTSFIYL